MKTKALYCTEEELLFLYNLIADVKDGFIEVPTECRVIARTMLPKVRETYLR